MVRKDKYTDDPDQEDYFLEDDTYDRYTGPDLSDDPMALDVERKKKTGRKERKKAEEARRLEAEREKIRAELLEEMKAAEMGVTTGDGTPEPTPDGEAEEEQSKRRGLSSYLMPVLSGNILSAKEVRKVYPYLIFIAFLGFIYIGNVFRMQHLYRKYDRLHIEVRELRAKSMTIASQKMEATRQSNIIKEIERRGIPLKESLAPNKVIPK